MTVCNMSIEAGSRAGLVAPDDTTYQYVAGREFAPQGEAFDQAAIPMKAFLSRFTREKDIKLFLDITNAPAPKNVSELGLDVLVPAYILSELKTGFQIGAMLFLPFLVIDLVVASVTFISTRQSKSNMRLIVSRWK